MGIYWLASYPKSGNTWFRIFLYNYLQNEEKPIDINSLNLGVVASAREWMDEVLGFDSSELSDDEIERLRPEVYRWSAKADKVGYHKIHDAYTYLPGGEPLVCRDATLGAIYILRNPLDVAVSYAHYCDCSLDSIIKYMEEQSFGHVSKNSRLLRQVPQFLSSWSGHARSWADAREIKVKVIRYEDMEAEPLATFGRAIEFLGLPVDAGRVAKAVRFSQFDVLKAQETEKGFKDCPARSQVFFRNGKTGDWQNVLSDRQVRQIISDHRDIMLRFGYIDEQNNPLV